MRSSVVVVTSNIDFHAWWRSKFTSLKLSLIIIQVTSDTLVSLSGICFKSYRWKFSAKTLACLIEMNGYEARHKSQRSKQRCHNLCWKLRDQAKCFVLNPSVCTNYKTKTSLLVSCSDRGTEVCARSRKKKRTKAHHKEFCCLSPLFKTMALGINTQE